MLKVVILTPYYAPVVGGVETHARRQAVGFAREGIRVWVLTKRMDASTPADDRVDGIPVVRVGPSGPRRGAAKWLMIPGVLAALLRRQSDVDAIVCPDYRGIGLAALAAGRLLRRPVVFQAATPGALSCANWDDALGRFGLRADGLPARCIKAPVRWIYSRADAYVCISREIEAEARTLVRTGSHVTYIPHGVDLARFAPGTSETRAAARRALGLAPGSPIVAFIGRLGVEKGVLDLLAAWQVLQASGWLERRQAVLILAGPEMPGHALDAGPRARTLAATLPPGSVRFLGALDDVRPCLAAADAVAQPSHYEAFGISAIEAMAAGVPLAATAVGGLREFLTDGENALLSPPHDPPALAASLVRLIDDGGLARRLAGHARLTVEHRFDEHVVTRRWLDLLSRLTTGTRTASPVQPMS